MTINCGIPVGGSLKNELDMLIKFGNVNSGNIMCKSVKRT